MIFDYKKEYQRYKRYYMTVEPLLKSLRFKGYFNAIMTLIALSVFGFFAIRPALKTALSLQKQIKDNSFVNQKLTEKIEALSLSQEKLSLIQNDLVAIKKILPDDHEFVSVIKTLESLEQKYEATVSGITFDKIVILDTPQIQTPILKEIPFSFIIEGGYNKVSSLFEDFIKDRRMVKINNFSISSLADNEVSLTVSANALFFQK